MCHRLSQLGPRTAHVDAGLRHVLVTKKDKDRQAEQTEPPRDQHVGGPDVEAVHGRQPQHRRLAGRHRQCQGETAEPTGESQGPPVAGDPSQPIAWRQTRKKRVVEHQGELERHIRDDKDCERRGDGEGLGRAHKGKRCRHDDARQRAQHQIAAAVASVGERAGDRGEQSDRDAAQRHAARPQLRAPIGVVGEGLGEVGRVDEGHNQRVERRVRPVVQAPRRHLDPRTSNQLGCHDRFILT